ncbi:MAG: SusC/RagA family TonB-linked outer membrane protein, partial [Candidatus Atribacteria bacterium]
EYDNYKGYDPSFSFDRFNFRSNLDFKLTTSTTLKINLSGFYSLKNTNYSNEGSTSGADAWMWAAVYSMPPDLYLPQYSDGRWGWSSISTKVNPVAAIYNLGIRQTRTTELNSDYHLEQNLDVITKGLSAKVALFYDNEIKSQGGLYDQAKHIRASEGNTPEKTIDGELYTGPEQDPSEYTTNWPITGSHPFDWSYNPWGIRGEEIGPDQLWESTIPVTRRMMYQFQVNYTRKFGQHNVTAMGLMKREEYARGSMFRNYREDWVFRTTYDYATKYFFEFNGAYNGSEQFGPGYRFDFFPSLAVGWNVANEKFWNISQINRLKFRYSIGMVGDDNISGGERWLYSSQLAYGGYARLGQLTNVASPYTFYRESVVGNPDIHWEKALKNNFGVELGLLKDLISVTYDYFTEDRTDILLAGDSRSIPPFFGTTPPGANVGEVKSHGHEIEIKLDKRTNTGWRFWSNLALSRNINKIIYKDDPILLDAHLKAQGFAIGQTKTTVRTGFYNNWDEVYASVPTETNDSYKLPGFYNLLDFNADGVIKGSEDAVPKGFSEIPQNTCNIQSGIGFKGLSVMFQLYGVNNVSRYFSFDNFTGSLNMVYAHVYDHWSKDNQDATSFLPRWKTSGENIGDYYVYDGSYWRLKTAEISYMFESSWIKKAGFASLKIFLNGNNILFWSDLPDDREVAWSGGSASSGTYHTVKRVNFGVDLTF